jgi:hypothetical protein
VIITCFDGNSMANLVFVNIRDASDGGIQCRPHDFIGTELQFSFARLFINTNTLKYTSHIQLGICKERLMHKFSFVS